MKSISGMLGSFVLAVLLVFCLFLIAQDSFASDSEDASTDGKIDVVYKADWLAPYRERRGPWSMTFSASVNQILPDQFRSPTLNSTYEDLFGSTPLNLAQVQIGAKYNFALGSLGASLIYGYGSVDDSKGIPGIVNQLEITKKALSIQYVMDNLFKEPYVAPYVSGEFYMFDWNEAEPGTAGDSGQTAPGVAMTIGALIQLNWLDPSAALDAQNSAGLENAFLDLYATQYGTSNNETDPNFETSMNYGVGIRLEF